MIRIREYSPIMEQPPGTEQPGLEKKEQPYEIINAELNEMLRDVRKSNEGASGIIMKLEPANFSPRLREALQSFGIDINEDTAAKILKVYAPGAAKREFKMQEAAFDVIADSGLTPEQAAMIPKPLFYTEMPVVGETRDNLRSQDIAITDENKVEIIIMDWIPGEDLTTQMYKKALSFFNPEHVAYPDNPNDFQQLSYAIGILLGFEKPNEERVTSTEEKNNNAQTTYLRNLTKLRKFLESKGAHINPIVEKQIRNSVQVLHTNDIWHNDLHERNVEAVGDIFSEHPEGIRTYIIDFGTASPQPGERVLSDSYLVDSLRNKDKVTLFDSPAFAEAREKLQDNNNFLRAYALLRDSLSHQNYSGNPIESADALFSDDDGYRTIIGIEKLVDDGRLPREKAKELLTSFLAMTKDKRVQRKKNLKQFSESL